MAHGVVGGERVDATRRGGRGEAEGGREREHVPLTYRVGVRVSGQRVAGTASPSRTLTIAASSSGCAWG